MNVIAHTWCCSFVVIEPGPIAGATPDRQVGSFIVADPGTTDVVISVVVESSSCPSADPCDSCPSVQWAFRGVNIDTGVDYTVSDPCSDISNSSPYTFDLTIATLTSETSGAYSAVFSYLDTSQPLPSVFVTVPGDHSISSGSIG